MEKESFIKVLNELTDFFIKESNKEIPCGYTCEFSTSKIKLNKKKNVIKRATQKIRKAFPDTKWQASWIIGFCDTCLGYHKESPYHLDIHISYRQ